MRFSGRRKIGSGLALLAASLALSCRPGAAPKSAPAAKTFVGDAACAACHAAETKTHRISRHANTLRPVTTEALGSLAPPFGPIPKLNALLETSGAGLSVRPADGSETRPLSLAFGSGKSGMTFVEFVGDDRVFEFSQSYFPSTKKWYATPGHDDLEPDALGLLHKPSRSRECVACHTVTLPDARLRPERKFFGVGCEACHGPGSAHVAASERGDYDRDRPENLAKLAGSALGKKCGVCHGQVQDIDRSPRNRALTNRFQVYGLEKSECFQKSGGKLSCVTCHNPHADAGHAPAPYEAICVTCHTAPTGKACPVQPKTDCVRCHMPTKPALPGTALPTFMADHWIRVQKSGAKS